jgi:hypothetical protein
MTTSSAPRPGLVALAAAGVLDAVQLLSLLARQVLSLAGIWLPAPALRRARATVA